MTQVSSVQSCGFKCVTVKFKEALNQQCYLYIRYSCCLESFDLYWTLCCILTHLILKLCKPYFNQHGLTGIVQNAQKIMFYCCIFFVNVWLDSFQCFFLDILHFTFSFAFPEHNLESAGWSNKKNKFGLKTMLSFIL